VTNYSTVLAISSVFRELTGGGMVALQLVLVVEYAQDMVVTTSPLTRVSVIISSLMIPNTSP
jgi:hypothetical protein